MALTVFKNQLWLIGGSRDTPGGSTDLSDIWRSNDGISWVQVETQGEQFAPRNHHSLTAWNDRMWLIGGYGGDIFSDVWSSVDGVSWRRDVEDIGSELHLHKAVAHGDALYILGIRQGGAADPPPVFRSVNGTDWESLAQAGFPEAQSHSLVYFDDRFWVLAGCESITPGQLGIWSSEDALSWVREAELPGPERCLRAASTVHNSEWFIIGGFRGIYSNRGYAMDDVWKTSDGRSWRRAFHSSIKMR